MKNKALSTIFTAIIALVGLFSALFFGREIISGLKSVQALRVEAGKSEALERAISKAKNELESTKENREKLDSLFIVEEKTEQGIVPFLDIIEADLNINNKSFEFISVDKDKKDESIIVFAGKASGSFAEAIRTLQIIEREVYPIEITKAIVSKNAKNTSLAGPWTASFQANIFTIPKAVKAEKKPIKK